MNNTVLFDFSIDRKNKNISIKREFDSEVEFVWDAWTKPELLDKWWAPEPYKTKTKFMDFREGGYWLYAMTGPENFNEFCRMDYDKINFGNSFSGLDGFCDENGIINYEMPRSKWNVLFSGNENVTTVSIVIEYKELEDLEKIVKMGFKEGFTISLENLDHYIEEQFRIRMLMKNDTAQRVCTYLNFPGNTEDAFLFYKKVFKSEFSGQGIQRFGDLPDDGSHPAVAESVKKMILHVELPIIANHILMGTDAPKEMGFTLIQGNNMHISLEPETRKETKRIFDELSDGGEVTMPLKDMFWGAYFGSFKDKFGINWMVNCNAKK
jgi:uncharacterized glyoxalase superfamily protein PhnB/uncharacterized protein YndB with AHSA1/START domain